MEVVQDLARRTPGSARSLIDAFRLAHVELVEWLEAECGFGTTRRRRMS